MRDVGARWHDDVDVNGRLSCQPRHGSAANMLDEGLTADKKGLADPSWI